MSTPAPRSLVGILLDLFPGRERWPLAGGVGISLVAALFDTIGVVSILPFMVLMLDPSAVDRYPPVRAVMDGLGVTTTQGVVLAIGIATALAVAAGNLAAAANTFVLNRLAARTEARVASTLFAGYLRQPYAFHLQRDAPSLLKVIDSDAHTVVGSVVLPLALATSRGAMAVAVLSLLVYREPAVAAIVAVTLVGLYAGIFATVRAKQRALAAAANVANERRLRAAHEGFGGVKELQVLGRLQLPIETFAAAVSFVARVQAASQTVAQLPRYALETAAFGGILLVTVAHVAAAPGAAHDAARDVVPMLALYAFAGYRLMPALQQLFAAGTSVRFAYPVLRGLHADFIRVAASSDARDAVAAAGSGAGSAAALTAAQTARARAPHAPTIRQPPCLRIADVTFTYAGAQTPALRHVTLAIGRGESVGLVGRTGAGKSTLADLILGVHAPDTGEITVDGVALRGAQLSDWRRRVGYVPQHVFLANDSVRANIAFGVPPREIDVAAVRRAAHLAQADAFIDGLADGWETEIGERGVRLSGGQRQRIGIARALYHEPDVLVFDEATSALDGLTEDAVIDAIRTLAGDRTVILIAHRVRTVESCDRVVMLEDGRVVADGRYRDVLASSDAFRQSMGRGAAARAAGGSVA